MDYCQINRRWLSIQVVLTHCNLYQTEPKRCVFYVFVSFNTVKTPQEFLYLFRCFMKLAVIMFRGNTVYSFSRLLWGQTNAQCQKLPGIFIMVCLAPRGTAKSLACATLLSERLLLWLCDPASGGDSWSPLHPLYPCELLSPGDIETRSDNSAMTLLGCPRRNGKNKPWVSLKTDR